MKTLARPAAPVAAVLLAALTACTDGGAAGSGTAGGVKATPARVHGTAGAPGLHDPYFEDLGNGGYDVRHYALMLAYDPASGRLDGTAEITARATQDLSSFNLDLAGMRVTGATVDGRAAVVSRSGQELTLRPRDDLGKGKTFRAVVRYSGTPERITDADGTTHEGWLKTADGVIALGEPTGSMAWFPGNHHPSDKASYDITMVVPEGLKAVSNGRLVSQRSVSGRSVFHWRSDEPMASYLATVAIGKYDMKESRTPSGIPVLTAVDPTVAGQVAAEVARLPEVVEWGVKNFGPYPFSSTGVIVERAGDAAYALETQTRPVIPADGLDTTTLVHELAHEWFGDSVTPKTWRDMWLNEGFATYAEWLWSEDHGGPSAEETFLARYEQDRNASLWSFAPADPPTAASISDYPVYVRGAMVVHKVRQALGDEAFFDIVRGWTKDHRYANASTDDFTSYVEARSGQDLTEMWDTWLYGKGKPVTSR
ncbi:M1 family metallopeptidase [Streptomyces sannanensis]|uniref:Aminopeptidase N n=1 Tax=Streptomyces sannanensis TaxID=285536 RepID=A0ABP6SBG3_9ACTN